MSALFLYDDARARLFEPFALTRPISELRAGAILLRKRWELALGVDAAGYLAASHLADFEEAGAPPASPATLPAGAIIANSRFAISVARRVPEGSVWMSGGQVVAVRTRDPMPVSDFKDGARSLDEIGPMTGMIVQVKGRWVEQVWDLVRDLPAQLTEDIDALGPQIAVAPPSAGRPSVLGMHPVYVENGAVIEPYVVFDAGAGPILVSKGATIASFTRIVGPCFIGEYAQLSADRIAASSIGEVSRVHGELSTSIVLGHSNKSHGGFVGHSILGRWVNLGAGTTTSNLKNTYGTVSLWTPGGVKDTGMQFLGTLFGDHAKTGIGLRLTTGCVIGAGANVFEGMPPKAVAPFSWGSSEPYGVYALDKFIAVAERAMSRRQVPLGVKGRRQLAQAWAKRWEP